MKFIQSCTNNTVKEMVKLQKKKERTAQHAFVVEGKHLIQEALKKGEVLQLFVLDGEDALGQDAIFCSQAVMNKMSSQTSDAKWIAKVKMPEQTVPASGRLLFLESVQDPGNLGTLVRSAVAFGMDGIICSFDCADIYNPKAVQASQGALFYMPVGYADLEAAILAAKAHMPVYAAALHQNSIQLSNVPGSASYGIVLGNEGQGLKDETISACTDTVYIEMEDFESLNVSIAGSIFMYVMAQKKPKRA
jgi:TrmH family RNA methyltransferase